MFKAVLFDFDGVIADTMEDNFLSWEYAFSKFNIKIIKQDYLLLEGMGPEGIANYFLNETDIEKLNSKKIILEKERYYFQHNRFRVFPEIYQIFNFLKENNILIGIVTGASKERIIETLNKKLREIISVLITSDDVINTKPHPESYLKAVEKLSLDPADCLIIENAQLGIKSAKSAGCICYSIETTLSKQFLIESDKCFKNHSSLFDFLRSLIKK